MNLDVYGIAYVAASIISLSVGIAAWRRRPAPGSLGLTILGLSQAWWSGAFALQWIFTDQGPSLAWLALRNIGLFVSPIGILVLVMGYVGKNVWLTRRRIALVAVVPAIAYLSLLTDSWHGLYMGAIEPTMKFNAGGPMFLVTVAYSYGLTLFAVGVLVAHVRKRPAYPWQAGVVLVALLLPVAHFAAQLAGYDLLPRVNSVPFTFTLSGALNWYALTQLGLFRLVPVARDQLIEQLPVGVVVFDSARKIIDTNPAALRMTGTTRSILGKTADQAFPRQRDTVLLLREDLLTGDSAVRRAEFLPGVHVEATASVLNIGDGERVATLVTLRDVSAEVEAAREIESQRERLAAALEQTSRILSAMTEGVMLVDSYGTVLQANPALRDILGLADADASGAPASSLVTGVNIEELSKAAHSAGSPIATVVEAAGSRVLHIETVPLSEVDANGASTLFVIRDETERHAAERMQRDFAANVAHELQTPLTGLSLLAHTIPRAINDDPSAVDGFVERLGSEVDRLVQLTDDLMMLSRAELGLSAATGESCEANEIVAEQVRAIEPLATARHQSIETDAENTLLAKCDAVDLGAVVGNLLRNAVRYADDGGHIAVRARSVEYGDGTRWVEIAVTDDGMGIPYEDQERIFERFYRVDKDRSRRSGGAGLGLSIVKQLTEKYGGSVTLASIPGQGATFTVRLPEA